MLAGSSSILTRLAHDALPATWTYYTMLKFNWGPADVALSLVAIGALTGCTPKDVTKGPPAKDPGGAAASVMHPAVMATINRSRAGALVKIRFPMR